MWHNIRAELPNGTHRDFTVGADSLANARSMAAQQLGQEFPASMQLSFDWRGQVVFVNTVPAEELIPTRRFPLSLLFKLASIKKDLWPVS